MEKEKIERAAIELCTTEGQEEWVKDYGVSCFKDGARWRINEAWHDVKEKPKWDEAILVECEYIDMPSKYHIIQGGNVDKFPVKRWAYLSDLLPDTRKEAEP